LKTFFKLPENREAYVEHLIGVIKEHMEPGQRGLVVCKQTLLLEQRDTIKIPRHPDDWNYQQPYHWNIEGRLLDAVNWGRGIGDNTWREADVVFLVDEFYPRRKDIVAQTQGLLNHPVSAGPIAKMTSLSTKRKEVEALYQGWLLRHAKQMGCRGNARNIGPDGVCGRQKIVFVGGKDTLQRFRVNLNRLFPGARLTRAAKDAKDKLGLQLLDTLAKPGLPRRVTTAWLSEKLQIEWRKDAKRLLATDWVQDGLRDLGWRYVSKRGKGGAYFESMASPFAKAA
jgi:hypothetical protein